MSSQKPKFGLEMKPVLEKIILVAKFQGFNSITESNWPKIQSYYGIDFQWNCVCDAKTILMDHEKLCKYFRRDLAVDVYMLCNPNGINSRSTLEFQKNTICNPDSELPGASASTEVSIVQEIDNFVEDCGTRNKDDENSVLEHRKCEQSVLQHQTLHNQIMLKKPKRDNKLAEIWEKNVPAASSSADNFGRLHMKRKLTKQEWTDCLELIKRKRLWPYMLGDGFWDSLKCLADIPTAKSASQLKEEFFTSVLPNRYGFAKSTIPDLRLRPSDPESLVAIFYEIRNAINVTSAIEALLADDMLSCVFSWEGWLHHFIEAVFIKPDSFWFTSEVTRKFVKEMAVNCFIETVAPKLVRCCSRYKILVDNAIDAISLDMDNNYQHQF